MKISIVTATYNCAQSIGHAQHSLAAQDYARENIEWIVVDGASTDGTLARIAEGTFQPDILISEPDKGIYDALNKGVARATGDFVGFLHADDFFAAPNVLNHIACALRNSGADALYGDLQYVQPAADGSYPVVRNWVSGIYYRRNLKWGWMPPHPTFYLRRTLFEQAKLPGGSYFDTSYTCAADYDFMMRVLAVHGVEPAYLRIVLVKMCLGGISNRSVGHIVRKSREDWRVIRRNRIGGLHTLVWKNLGKLNQFFHRE